MLNPLLKLSIRPFLCAVIISLAIAVIAKYQLSYVDDPDESTPLTEFSGVRAKSMLAELLGEQAPHPVDSEANRQVEKRLVRLIREMGYQEMIQDTPSCEDWRRGVVRCTHVRNIIVEIKGREPGPGILISAHYDSVPAGPGGSDAGAAVATLLESLRLLSLEQRPKNTLVFLFNEGEEFGLFGAKAFVDKHFLADEIKLALNVEARGSGGKSVMFETGEDSGWLVDHYANATTAPVSSSLFYEVYKYLPNDTDLTVFKAAGMQGLNFAHAEKEPHYHTPLDNLKNLATGTIQYHGDNVWGILDQIKDADLNSVDNGNLVFTDVLGIGIVHWSQDYSLTLSILLLLVLSLAHWQSYKSCSVSNFAITKSVVALVLMVSFCGLVAWATQSLVQTIGNSATPWRADMFPMRVCIWLSVTSLGLFVGNWLLKNQNFLERAIAVLWLWGILNLLSSLVVPGISFLFLIPLCIGVAAILVINLNFVSVSEKSSAIVAICLTALPVIASTMFFPVSLILEVMVNYQISVAVGIIIGFGLTALLPLMTFNRPQQSMVNQILIGGAVLAAMSLGWTATQATYTPEMPQPLNLYYVQENEQRSVAHIEQNISETSTKSVSPTAIVLAGSDQHRLPESLSQSLLNYGDNVESGGSLFWSSRTYHQVKTPSLKLAQSQLFVINESSSNTETDGREIQVEIRTQPKDLSDVKVYLPHDSGLEAIITETNLFRYAGEPSIRNNFYEYHCRGQSCKNLKLQLKFPHNKKVKVIVVRVAQGLPEALVELQERRGADAIQRQSGDQSFIYSVHEI